MGNTSIGEEEKFKESESFCMVNFFAVSQNGRQGLHVTGIFPEGAAFLCRSAEEPKIYDTFIFLRKNHLINFQNIFASFGRRGAIFNETGWLQPTKRSEKVTVY